MGGNDVGSDNIKTMFVAGMLSVLVKALGLFKESTIAYFFGVSTFVDFYVLALVFVAFFLTNSFSYKGSSER